MYKCTVIDLSDDPEAGYGPIYQGECDNTDTEEVATEDIQHVNRYLVNEGRMLIGNFICNYHAERVEI